MAGTPARASWRDAELGVPELARLGMARLSSAGVVLLGTLRRDGSPRISPVDACFAGGQLLIGAVARSARTADLRRDPRYVLHSVVTGSDSGVGELKLYGSVAEADQSLRAAADGAWWLASAPEEAVVPCPAHRAGGVRRLEYQAWLDDGPPVVSRKQLCRGQPP